MGAVTCWLSRQVLNKARDIDFALVLSRPGQIIGCCIRSHMSALPPKAL